jgi:CRISPR-associated protein Cas1
MSFLYISESNIKIHIDAGRIIAEKSDGMKTMLPLEILEGVVLIGNASITTPCVKELLVRGIPVTYLASSGSFYGRLESTKHIDIQRQREQFRRGDDEVFCLDFSKKIISAKINNQIVLLRRYNRYAKHLQVERLMKDIQKLISGLERTKKSEEVLGYEGASARKYFQAISLMIRKEFAFSSRNRRPPLDPFNSLLSLGYTLLMYELYTAVVNKGLHPYAGLLHQDKRGHPALVSDLMEEWRPIIVDSLAINLLNNGVLKTEDFIKDKRTGGVTLEKAALKKYLREFEKKIRTKARYLKYIESTVSFRRAIQHQAGSIAKAIQEKDISIYQPIRLR